jgi:excinuclease ABC subunit A
VLHRLVDQGNSVLLIEHNLDLIKNADWVIDLGPGAGHEGGSLLACGTPEMLAQCEQSHTGRYLRKTLEQTALAASAD